MIQLLDMSLACHMKLLVNLLSSQLPAALCIVPHNSALRNQSGPPFCCLLMRTWVDGAPTIDATIPIDARDVRATRRCRAATPSYVAWAQCVRRLFLDEALVKFSLLPSVPAENRHSTQDRARKSKRDTNPGSIRTYCNQLPSLSHPVPGSLGPNSACLIRSPGHSACWLLL
eukprot:scaffold4327_cov22-Tisochrysis_lutea.AAC.2